MRATRDVDVCDGGCGCVRPWVRMCEKGDASDQKDA